MKFGTEHNRSRMTVARVGLMTLLCSGLYGCTAGLSCGGDAGGCVNAYPYPTSELENGVATVDDGMRMRMTQASLDFLREHLQELLLASFETDPGNPDRLVVDVGPVQMFGSSYGNAWLGRRPNEPEQALQDIGYTRLHPTNVILDIALLSEQLEFEFVEGTQDALRVRVQDVPVGIDARAFADWSGGGTAGCDINGQRCPASDPDCGVVTTVSIELMVLPDVGQGAQCDTGAGECLLIDVEVTDFQVGGISSSDLDISVPPHVDVGAGAPNGCLQDSAPEGCEPECSDRALFDPFDASRECSLLCGATEFLGDVVLALSGALESFLEPLIRDMLEEAIRDGLADYDGAPVSLADRIALAQLSPNLINSTAHDLGFFVGPTGNAFDVNCPANVSCGQTRGMDFVLKSGVEAAPPEEAEDAVELPHPCVVPLTGASFAALYGDGEFRAPDATPLTGAFEGAPYHVGMSLARAALNQGLFGTYNAGVLCIEVDSEDVHTLSGGAFPLSAGTLDLLTGGTLRQFANPSAPALISIAPAEPPIFRFGAGDDSEGHLIATWKDVVVSFYVLVYERFSRVFAVEVDISASLTVFVDPASQTLQVAITDGPVVDGFDEVYNELLPGVDFEDVLDSLLGIAFDSLLGDELGFGYDFSGTLSDTLGVPLYLDVRGIETVPQTGEREFLNAYLSMSDTPPSPRLARMPSALRLAEDSGLFRSSPGATEAHQARLSPTGAVRLEGLSERLGPEHQVFAQVDFGTWRGPFEPSDDGVLTVEDPKLKLVGEHELRFRVQRTGAPGTLMPLAAGVRFWVDVQAPWAELSVVDDALVADGQDVGTRPEDLRFSWKTDDGEWSPFTSTREVPLGDLDDVRRASVRARDRAGNVSRPVTLDLGTARVVRARRTDSLAPVGDVAEVTPPAYGCAASEPAALLPSFALLALLALRRRRPRRGRGVGEEKRRDGRI